jgi:hypothetical protein
MMIHLESGACSSQVRVNDIDWWASQHPSFNYHIDSQALDRYECPQCEHRFHFLSGLLQHLESKACGGNIEDNLGDLPSFLETEILCHVLGPSY